MFEEINQLLQFCIIVVGLFLIFFLLNNKEIKSNLWLAGLIFTLVIHFVNLFAVNRDAIIPNLGMVYGLAYGPFIIYFITSHSQPIKSRALVDYIPAFVLLLWILLVDRQRLQTPKLDLEITRILVFGHVIYYLAKARRLSRQLKLLAIQTRSKIDNIKIRLVERVVLVLAFIFLIALAEPFVSFASDVRFNEVLQTLISVFVLLGILSFIYQGLENPFVFHELTSNEREIASEAQKQYSSSPLSQEQSDQYLSILLSTMSNQKPYKDFNLTIDQLSQITEIPSRHLSQIINSRLNQNFFDFINSHRIEDAKGQLLDHDKRISEIMYDIGFSSRSSFNTAFRKYSGQTPTQFRKSN